MIAARRIRNSLVALLLVVTTPACLFDTREDEVHPPPDGGGGRVPLNDPLQVFVAISETLNDSQQDANYENAVSSEFIFSPLLQDSLDQNFEGTNVYDNWDKTREMDVLGLLLADAKNIVAEFNPSKEIDKNTFVRFRVEYELSVVNTTAPGDTARYRGVAYFDVRNESGNWRLTFWDEIDTVEGFATWGFLRGILGLRLNP